MKKTKLIFSDEEIKKEHQYVQELYSQNKIKEKIIPTYYCKNKSDKNKTVVILLSLLLGFLGIDRWYLGKKISAATKLLLISVLTPILIYLWVGLDNYAFKNYPDAMIIWSILIFSSAAGFYFIDLVMSVTTPRDIHFQCVGSKYRKDVFKNELF
ncbi:NINE protein [Mycoplasmopsis alligatoris]|uniref:TM2 domain protein n=1 Tax=Mycoplasmopsis alligatoris A21JP2 TaxID=747682 RepID=D4XVF0_9BACT|nr:NINE protein [Mycoplasmopsis alligatoris]EFF41698.1 TM2 domain protein [Mycoplasmopsis alligatoris A21JP2]